MSEAVASSLGIVAYLALFFGVGLLFIFVNLLVGRFLRPFNPHEEKLEIYECGEPTIGSSFVQFDLRFYVVALLFIIFDVEVAFFFPWAVVFGKNAQMMDKQLVVAERKADPESTNNLKLTKNGEALYQELGVRNPQVPTVVPASLKDSFARRFQTSDNKIDTADKANFVSHEGARQLLWISVLDIGAFFAILMVGFAYVWKRGDLDWVRALSQEKSQPKPVVAGSSP